MGFRFSKSEPALESPRPWYSNNRLRLLGMVALAFAFLLSLLRPDLERLREALLRVF